MRGRVVSVIVVAMDDGFRSDRDPFGWLGPLDGVRLLEVGCATGANLAEAVERGAVVWGVDRSVELLAEACRRVPSADLRLGDIEELPFDSATFDLVCAFGALPANSLHPAFAELARVCRAGGLILLSPRSERPASSAADTSY